MMRAVEKKTPFILFAASGGARMQEGILSLMQMPRTTIAVQRLREAKLPYIVVLTDPTTGGVTASYAMLGDVHIAEPGALICFAGPRVIQQTIREQLPEGFQRAEYLLAHGMIDMVVHRHKMRETLSRICRILMRAPAVKHDHGSQEAQRQHALRQRQHRRGKIDRDAQRLGPGDRGGNPRPRGALRDDPPRAARQSTQRRRYAADDALAQRQTALMSAIAPSRSPARSLIGGSVTRAQLRPA